MADQEPAAAKRRSPTRMAIGVLVSLVLVVAIFYFLLRDIDLRLVWAEIRAMTWIEDAILAVLAAWNLATATAWSTSWATSTPSTSVTSDAHLPGHPRRP
jgi:hypothetical protein